MKTGQNDKMYN